jgi:hypothetical protein
MGLQCTTAGPLARRGGQTGRRPVRGGPLVVADHLLEEGLDILADAFATHRPADPLAVTADSPITRSASSSAAAHPQQ